MDELTAEWLRFSDMDLRTSKHLYDSMNPAPLEIICYHCQQSAEKALKAFLIHSGVKPAKTHDLETLRGACRLSDDEFDEITDQCARINDYSTQPRYPMEMEITDGDAVLALNDCAEIINFVKRKILVV